MLKHRGAHPNYHFKPAQEGSRHFIATKISDRISLKLQKKIHRKERFPFYSVISVDILVDSEIRDAGKWTSYMPGWHCTDFCMLEFYWKVVT